MKVRNGFVSNSSSASFIVTLGVTKDIEVIKKLSKSYNFEIVPISELYTDDFNHYRLRFDRETGRVSYDQGYAYSSIYIDDVDASDIDTFIVFGSVSADDVPEDEDGYIIEDEIEWNDDEMNEMHEFQRSCIKYDEDQFTGRDG